MVVLLRLMVHNKLLDLLPELVPGSSFWSGSSLCTIWVDTSSPVNDALAMGFSPLHRGRIEDVPSSGKAGTRGLRCSCHP